MQIIRAYLQLTGAVAILAGDVSKHFAQLGLIAALPLELPNVLRLAASTNAILFATIRDPNASFVTASVEQNGRNVMQAHTADMINGLRDLIRFLSSVSTLMPGTLITTGTPAGVSKLADGDHLKGTIDGIGTMELNVAAEN